MHLNPRWDVVPTVASIENFTSILDELYGQVISVEKPCGRINKCDAIHVTVVTDARACEVWGAFVTFHRGRPKLRTGENLIATIWGMPVVDQPRASSSRTDN